MRRVLAAAAAIVVFGACSSPSASAPAAAPGAGGAAKRCAMTTHDGKPLLLEWWRQDAPDRHDGVRISFGGDVSRNRTEGAAEWRAAGVLAPADLARLQVLLRESFTKLPPAFATDGDATAAASEAWTACVDGQKRLVKVKGVDAVDDAALAAFRDAVAEMVAGAKPQP